MSTVTDINPFIKYSDFVSCDNRIHREKNPITAEVLLKKHRSILPPEQLSGKSVLDLGCCIGASGIWAMHYGASHYTGVEIQSEYVNTAQELLAPHSARANIVQSSIEEYLEGALAKNTPKTFDIVLILAVLHVSFDYYQILKSISSICNEFIIVENLMPVQKIPKDGGSSNIVEYHEGVSINLAGDERQSMLGSGVRISTGALDMMMGSLGFAESQELKVEPIADSLDVYSNKNYEESRYICRYSKNINKVTSLTQDLSHNLDGAKIPWKQTTDNWVFDKKVAENFDHIAQDNIPNYDIVINKCLKIANKKFGASARIIDVGSATGYTLRRCYEQGFNNLTGIECSKDMIDASWTSSEISIIHSDVFPESLGKFDVVMANWVIHFIKDRLSYLESIYQHLDDNGVLVITEKVSASELSTSLYHDFKLENGLSKEEIRLKSLSIKNILTPKPITWYFDVLREIGFHHVELIDASFSFATILAFKGSRDCLEGDC